MGSRSPAVEETIKWGRPFFVHGGILCGVAAFKAHCAVVFWNGARILGASRAPEVPALGQFGRVTSLRDLPSRREFRALVRRAAAFSEAGVTRAAGWRKPRPAPRIPSDLARALASNAPARDTYRQLSPSGRRDYVEWLSSAKRRETRARRLATAVEWLSAGKPHNWRYTRG